MSSKQTRSEIRKVPLRKCVGCQEMKPKKELLRIVRISENDAVIDRTGKQNGRGAYLCHSLECLQKAQKTKALQRSLQIAFTPEMFEQIQEEMIHLAGT